MTWTHGYNVDHGYTYGYYKELDPSFLDLCTLIKGIMPPSISSGERLRFLELGCGQGFNLCLIASCHPDIEFVGIDFNPQHIAHAKALAKSANLNNVNFHEIDFIELAKILPKEFGKFHYLAAHGVLSWIPEKVCDAFVQCIYEGSLPGSIVYISYNTLPGWLSYMPVQHLLRLWQVRESLSSLKVLELGHKRLKRLIEINSVISRVLPNMKSRLEKFSQQDPAYLIQEYLHDEWKPFWFDEVHAKLSKIKLNYLNTATSSDWFLMSMLPNEWRAVIDEFADPVLREVMFDVVINQNFRRDIWIRGQVPLWQDLSRKYLVNTQIFLLHRPKPVNATENPYKFSTSLGEVTGKPEVYGPLYDALQVGPKTIGELISVPISDSQIESEASSGSQRRTRTLGDLIQALGLMLNAGHVAISRNMSDRAMKNAQNLNRAIFQAVWHGAPYRFIVATAVPCVIASGDVDMMFAFAKLSNPKADASELGKLLTQQLLNLGKGLTKEGKALTTAEEIEPQAISLAEVFLRETLPRWQRLGIL